MRALFIIFLVVLLYNKSFVKDACAEEIDCNDLKSITVLGHLFLSLSDKEKGDVQVKFFLSTNIHKDAVEISPIDWSGLTTNGFEPSKKTFIIIHGFSSSGTKPWVVEMKNNLLLRYQANVIAVDWSQASNRKNYVNAARNTIRASNQILSLLEAMRAQVESIDKTSAGIQWNHLHFIGHSLGAHVSAQTADLLKQDKFWKVERITGLDPAKPCFTQVNLSLRIDKEDADFVDIIHTQAGTGGTADALGFHEDVGHIDFYVNGGVVQPQCMGSFYTPIWYKMICSHKFAIKYFSESLVSPVVGFCTFSSYKWDGTYEGAQAMLAQRIKRSVCYDCPKLGMHAVKSKRKGKFIVFTTLDEPHCGDYQDNDVKNVRKVIRQMKGT